MKDVTALVSARLSNLVAGRFPAVGRRATARQVAKYWSSGGRKGNTIVGRPVFLLDVVGRSSGARRPVMLMYVPVATTWWSSHRQAAVRPRRSGTKT